MPLLPIAAAGSSLPSPRPVIDDNGEWEIDPRGLDVGEKVGGGATAEVFRGVWMDKVVAVKQLSMNVDRMDGKDQENLRREIAILRKVQHPKLVNLIGVCSKQSPFTIVLEFCSGGCLFVLLHERIEIEISVTQSVKMVTDAAVAMEFLHNLDPPIIHRDLKSMNLLLWAPVEDQETQVEVKVSDFGIARMLDSVGGECGKMTIGAGTGHWMAPEVLAGKPYNAKADIYSYAMVLF